jgi:hypothetical protein
MGFLAPALLILAAAVPVPRYQDHHHRPHARPRLLPAHP